MPSLIDSSRGREMTSSVVFFTVHVLNIEIFASERAAGPEEGGGERERQARAAHDQHHRCSFPAVALRVPPHAPVRRLHFKLPFQVHFASYRSSPTTLAADEPTAHSHGVPALPLADTPTNKRRRTDRLPTIRSRRLSDDGRADVPTQPPTDSSTPWRPTTQQQL